MGHFIIDLPENKKGDVRWGMLHKMQFSFFRKNKSDSKIGYIVNVSDSNGKMEYRLFKSQNDEWSKDPEGKMELDDNTLTLIKNAIIQKELSGH
ncbi:MAG TPA: hypothetical protein VII44_09910 [Puia sp.]